MKRRVFAWAAATSTLGQPRSSFLSPRFFCCLRLVERQRQARWFPLRAVANVGHACSCDGESDCPAAKLPLEPGPEALIPELAQCRLLGGSGVSHEADVLLVFPVRPATANGLMHGQHRVQRLDQGPHTGPMPTCRAVTRQPAEGTGLGGQGIDQIANLSDRNRVPLGQEPAGVQRASGAAGA